MTLRAVESSPLAGLDEFASTAFDAIHKLQREAREKDSAIDELEREVHMRDLEIADLRRELDLADLVIERKNEGLM